MVFTFDLLSAALTFGFLMTAAHGVTLTYDKQTSPVDGSPCGVVRCQHAVSGNDLYVKQIEIFSVALAGAKLASVQASDGHQVISKDVLLPVNRTFAGKTGFLELRLLNRTICNVGEFLCVVNYVDEHYEEQAAVSIYKPYVESECSLDDQCQKLEALLSSVQTINNTMRVLTQSVLDNKVNPDDLFRHQWRLAFRGQSGIRKSVYLAYLNGTGIPGDVEAGCKQVGQTLPCTNHYRNDPILNNWADVSQVAFAIYKNNVRVKEVIFNGAGSTYMGWLDHARVVYSSWADMTSSAVNYFSIQGDQSGNLRRVFDMNSQYNACPNDIGWFVAIDNENGGCTWEQNTASPVFKYAPGGTMINWNDAHVDSADYMAVFVKYFNVP
ncbi:hypothetical protein Btru_077360 [Bulinus truncatus]|nr:hypothetical protein Btru_077360 [Bulinus truncatus]